MTHRTGVKAHRRKIGKRTVMIKRHKRKVKRKKKVRFEAPIFDFEDITFQRELENTRVKRLEDKAAKAREDFEDAEDTFFDNVSTVSEGGKLAKGDTARFIEAEDLDDEEEDEE